MSSLSIDLRNSFLAGIYVVFGCISSIILAFVILIHFKYAKFRQNQYSIILACLFCEIVLPLHYLSNGLRGLITGRKREINGLCIADATILDLAVSTLLFYNIFTMLFIFFNKLPPQLDSHIKSKESRVIYYTNSTWNKNAYKYLHMLSIGFGICHCLLFFFSQSYGITNFGGCFMKQNYSPYFIPLGIPLLVYIIISIIYMIINSKKKYYRKFPTLKNFSIYVCLTSFCWSFIFLRYFIKIELMAGYNSMSFTAELISAIVIIYIRISNWYVQAILKQGDSNNKFIQAFLIFFCMDDGSADVEHYERRTSIKLNSLTGEFNINY